MGSTYYEYQDVKVRIVHRLFKLEGWKVYGWSPDRSDSMTDYWDPESWRGIAEKNGYRLVIDHNYAAEERRNKITVILDSTTKKKIAKLEQMTQERGATKSEEETAKAKIELLKSKCEEETKKTVKSEIIEPGHMANPPRCNWHIEKDGIIIDKGTGLLKFHRVPDITNERDLKEWQDFNNLSETEWKENFKKSLDSGYYYFHGTDEDKANLADIHYEEAKEKYALLEQFNQLINRINTTCGGMVGNSTEFYTYKEVVETQYKTGLKPIEKPGSIKEGQCFIVKRDFMYGILTGFVYRIHEHYTRDDGSIAYIAYRLGKGYKKERTGSATSSNSWGIWNPDDFMKWFDKGALAFCELEEVKTPYEIKKVVKVKNETAEEPEAETMTEEVKTETVTEEPEKEAANPEPETIAEELEEIKPEEPEPKREAETMTEEKKDMFETLAAAFVNKKTVKSDRKPDKAKPAKEEPKSEEKPETAPTEEAATEEEPEALPAPGYQGNNNDILPDEVRKALSEGVQIAHGEKYEHHIYISAPYRENSKLVYSMYTFGQTGTTPKPGYDYKYFGFMIGTDLYTSRKPILAKLWDDIDRRLIELVPDEATAAHGAANATDLDEGRKDYYKDQHYKEEARRLFYKGEKPQLYLYAGRPNEIEKVIDYLIEPEPVIEEYALKYICDKSGEIYERWKRYNGIKKEYDSIVANPDNEEHVIYKISHSITEEKTVRIELSNGEEVKAEADAVKGIIYNYRISEYRIAAADREKLPKNEYGRPADIYPADIVTIRHGGKVLYKAERRTEAA